VVYNTTGETLREGISVYNNVARCRTHLTSTKLSRGEVFKKAQAFYEAQLAPIRNVDFLRTLTYMMQSGGYYLDPHFVMGGWGAVDQSAIKTLWRISLDPTKTTRAMLKHVVMGHSSKSELYMDHGQGREGHREVWDSDSDDEFKDVSLDEAKARAALELRVALPEDQDAIASRRVPPPPPLERELDTETPQDNDGDVPRPEGRGEDVRGDTPGDDAPRGTVGEGQGRDDLAANLLIGMITPDTRPNPTAADVGEGLQRKQRDAKEAARERTRTAQATRATHFASDTVQHFGATSVSLLNRRLELASTQHGNGVRDPREVGAVVDTMGGALKKPMNSTGDAAKAVVSGCSRFMNDSAYTPKQVRDYSDDKARACLTATMLAGKAILTGNKRTREQTDPRYDSENDNDGGTTDPYDTTPGQPEEGEDSA
jgi:hypothetical protein